MKTSLVALALAALSTSALAEFEVVAPSPSPYMTGFIPETQQCPAS